MSRIGTMHIDIPQGVSISQVDSMVTVKGPLGELSISVPHGITVTIHDSMVTVARLQESKKVKSLHGLVRSLLANAVTGVTKHWEKHLEVVGTGYRVKLSGKNLVFEVGYSHPVEFPAEEAIAFAVAANKVTVSGPDKQKVGQVGNRIKAIRKPDPYKGKGIRYAGEVLRLKPGKKAKS